CDVRWVTGADAFLATLGALRLPSGEGFAWCAGEAAVMAKTREILLREHGLPKEAMRVAAYWKQGASSFHEHLE
ncbi:MAG: SIP domain-containing protein, partial [Burkholderiales bacterium]|nr:SIP domain-containing protein [Burkholderiales bacterium]